MANPSSWACPNCHRRVPGYVAVCHCGTRRTDARAGAPAGRRTQGRGGATHDLPTSFWVLVGVMVILIGGMIASAFVPPTLPPHVPLIGYVDRLPTPTPKR